MWEERVTDFASGLKSLSGNRAITPDASDFLYDAAEEIERLRTALAPFVADKLPSQKRTDIDFNEWGLRCLMSKMEIARRDARKALAVASEKL
jgi:hypothetical protein